MALIKICGLSRVEDIKSVYDKVDSYRKGKLKDEETDQTEAD